VVDAGGVSRVSRAASAQPGSLHPAEYSVIKHKITVPNQFALPVRFTSSWRSVLRAIAARPERRDKLAFSLELIWFHFLISQSHSRGGKRHNLTSIVRNGFRSSIWCPATAQTGQAQ